MDSIASVNPSANQAAQAVQADQVSAPSTDQAQAPSGLPPFSLVRAASANTVDAELVSSQWGIDRAAVGGVYGGAAEAGGLFSGTSLLPLLANLTHANAEQALSLMGITTPKPGSGSGSAGHAASAAASTAFKDLAALAETAGGAGSSAGIVVDPLWGRSA